MKTVILLPTYNEEENIEDAIERIRKVNKKYEIVVVDSESKDRTVEIAKRCGARVISVKGRGKGRAVGVAFRKINADFLIMMDADGTYPSEKIPEFLEKLKECDVVIGSRFAGTIEEGAMKTINRIGNIGLTFFASLLYGRKITDVCSGMWGFRREAYKKMEITAPHFELEADLFSEAVKKNMRICEVPIVYKKRGGAAKLRVSDGARIAWWLLKKRFEE
jgi:dolichol-phosphate mannosyltransferase